MGAILIELRQGKIEAAKTLINKGKNLDAQDSEGITALQFCAQTGLYEIVKLLLVAGANPNIIADFPEDNLEKFSTTEEAEEEIKELNILEKCIQEIKNLGSSSALHAAVKHKNGKIVKLLLAYGADPNVLDPGACTPLHWAATRGYSKLVDILLDAGANPNIQDLAKSTALHEAVRKGHTEIVKILLENNANPNLLDISGESPYGLAATDVSLQQIMQHSSRIMPDACVSH